jgi:hypothetical protein
MGATPKSLYFDGSSEASALPVRTVQGADAEAQRAARDAVMQIRLFPDLTVALRGGARVRTPRRYAATFLLLDAPAPSEDARPLDDVQDIRRVAR